MEATLVFTTIPEIQFMLLLMPDVGFESDAATSPSIYKI